MLDWIGQLDVLTLLIVAVIVGLGITVFSMKVSLDEKDRTISWRDSQIVGLRAELDVVTTERNELQNATDVLIREMDLLDPAGPVRRLVEDLRRRREADEYDERL